MAEEKPLTEEDKRFLGALKLFFEARPELDVKTEQFDKLTPRDARFLIKLYHESFDHPLRFRFFHQIIWPLVLPVWKPYNRIQEFLGDCYFFIKETLPYYTRRSSLKAILTMIQLRKRLF